MWPRTHNGGPEGMLIESDGEEPSSPIDRTQGRSPSSIWLKTFGHRELPALGSLLPEDPPCWELLSWRQANPIPA